MRIFGTTAVTDSYFKAFLLPDTLLTIFITGALLGLVIPLYIRARKISPEEGAETFGTFFLVLNGFYFLAAVGCLLFLSPLLHFLFPETLPEQQVILRNLTALLIFSNFFFAISNFLGHFLLAHKRFMSYSVSPLLYNAGIIAGILWGYHTFGIYAAAWGALIGSVFHFLLRLGDFILSPEKFRLAVNIRNPLFRDLLRGMWPKALSLLSLQIGFYFFARIGDSWLGVGNYSAFQYARNLQSFAVSLFGVSLATAVFPFLAEFVAENKMDRFVHRLEKSLRQILFLALPAAVGMALLSDEIVRFIYGSRATNLLTVIVLIPLALTIPFESIRHLLVRALHVLKSTILPMFSSLLFLAILMGASAVLIFGFGFGIEAFGISYFLGFIAQIIFLFFCFPFFGVRFPWKEFLSKLGKTLMLILLMSIVVFGTKQLVVGRHFLIELFLPALFGGCVFLGGAFFWKSSEVTDLPLWKWRKKLKTKDSK